MLEQLINSLDNRGILVINAMLGRRCIELLESEKESKEESKPVKSKLLLPAT